MTLFDVYPLFPVNIVRGQGCRVWDDQGIEYLDLYGGHAVISIGHAHPHYVEAVSRQVGQLGFYSNSVINKLQQQLAERLGKACGYEDYRLFLINSGAEANENALKLASFHTGRTRVLSAQKAFHGRTSLAVEVTNNPKIIAPINAGAKLFKAGKSTYRLAAVVTWGNLYIASQKADFTLESLNGAEVTLFGENTINASVVLAVLEAKGIQPAAVSYLSGAAETQAELLSNPEAIVVTADPAVTAAKIKNENVKTISVQELLKEAFGTDGYAQAGLFVRADTLAADEAGVKAFLDAVKDAADKAETDVKAMAEAAVKLEILPNAKVAEAAIPGCSIRFTAAAEAREAIEKTAAFDLSQYGGEVPADEFYYTGE